MKPPRALRKQLSEYAKQGFHAIQCEPRSGAHFKVWFAEFSEPQILTKNVVESHSMQNNIAKFKRLVKATAP